MATVLFFIVWTFLATQGHSQDVRVQYRIFDGLNDSQPPHYIDIKESPSMSNMLIDEPGAPLQKRLGSEVSFRLPSGNVPTGSCNYFTASGDEFLVIGDDLNVYYTSDFSTFTFVKAGQGGGFPIRCRTILDELWVANGVDTVFKINGSSVGTITITDFDGGGSPARAAVPRGRFLLYEKNRAYTVRSSTGQSSVFYSIITHPTTGDPIIPSSSTAWQADSEVFCGRNDGSPIYGAIEFNGSPYIFKENSIWKVIDIDDFNVGCIKVLDGVGSRSHDSLVAINGLLYFVGVDGIYQFDGSSVQRIDSKIRESFQSISQPKTDVGIKNWSNGPEFSATGTTLTRISTSIVSDVITLDRFTLDDFEDGDYTAKQLWRAPTELGGSTVAFTSLATNGLADSRVRMAAKDITNDFTDPKMFHTTSSLTDSGEVKFNVYMSSPSFGTIQLCNNSTCGTSLLVKLASFGNNQSQVCGTVDSERCTCAGGFPQTQFASFAHNNNHRVSVTKNSSGQVKVYVGGILEVTYTSSTLTDVLTHVHAGLCGGNTAQVPQPTNAGKAYVEFDNFTTNLTSGVWTSEKINAGSALTRWLRLEATTAEQGGSILFTSKSSATNAGLDSVFFSTITVGSQISTVAANTFVQFKATITISNDFHVAAFDDPQIQLIRISWVEGGEAAASPAAINWDGRYLIAVATAGTTLKSKMFYYTRSPLTAWSRFDGLNITGFQRYGGNFYGISSTTNTLVRLFTGSTDEGASIDAFWQSRDETLGEFSRKARYKEAFVDYSKDTGSSFTFGISTNSGASFIDRTINFSGSGRGVTRVAHSTMPLGDTMRFRIRDNSTNAQLKFYGMDVYLEQMPRTIR